MSDKCLLCNAPVDFGKNYIVKDGKKSLEKFEPGTQTPHVCKPKQQGKFPPRKPQEGVKYAKNIRSGDVIEYFEVWRTANVGELDYPKVFAELKGVVDKIATSQ